MSIRQGDLEGASQLQYVPIPPVTNFQTVWFAIV